MAAAAARSGAAVVPVSLASTFASANGAMQEVGAAQVKAVYISGAVSDYRRKLIEEERARVLVSQQQQQQPEQGQSQQAHPPERPGGMVRGGEDVPALLAECLRREVELYGSASESPSAAAKSTLPAKGKASTTTSSSSSMQPSSSSTSWLTTANAVALPEDELRSSRAAALEAQRKSLANVRAAVHADSRAPQLVSEAGKLPTRGEGRSHDELLARSYAKRIRR